MVMRPSIRCRSWNRAVMTAAGMLNHGASSDAGQGPAHCSTWFTDVAIVRTGDRLVDSRSADVRLVSAILHSSYISLMFMRDHEER